MSLFLNRIVLGELEQGIGNGVAFERDEAKVVISFHDYHLASLNDVKFSHQRCWYDDLPSVADGNNASERI